MTDINKEYEKEYYDEYRNNYYNPDDDDGEPGINLNWKRIQKGFHDVAGNDQETAETLSGMQTNLETLNTDVETLKTDVDEIKESIKDLNAAVETAEQAAEVAAASEAAAQAAQAAIEEIAESIPEDYSDLSDDVDKVKYDFIDLPTSENKWNPARMLTDKAISTSSATYGDIVDNAGNTVSNIIPVTKGHTVMWYYSTSVAEPSNMAIGTTVVKIAEYDESGNCLYITPNWQQIPYTVQNENTYYVRVQVATRPWNMIIVDDTNIAVKAYVPYKANLNLLTELYRRIGNEENAISAISNPVEVILPSHIYGVAGQEINIYKQNLVLFNRLKSLAYIHTRIAGSVQSDERTIWTPTPTELTEETKPVEVFTYGLQASNNQNMIACGVPKDTGNGNIKVLICGDSKVQNGYVSYHFLHDFDDDNMSVTLLGSKYNWQTDNRNEGYGSKTATWFATDADSPCVFNGEFNFAQYMSTQGYTGVDFVFLNFGTNDATQSSSGYAEAFVSAITTMIESIHDYNANINVIVGMCEGVCTFWDTNNSEFISWDANNKIQQLHKATIAAFDNRHNENIYVCPMYMGMDLTQDYNMTEVPLSQRDGDMNSGQGDGKTRMQVTDRVHQSEVGYWKNADYMYALVKYIVAKSLTV